MTLSIVEQFVGDDAFSLGCTQTGHDDYHFCQTMLKDMDPSALAMAIFAEIGSILSIDA